MQEWSTAAKLALCFAAITVMATIAFTLTHMASQNVDKESDAYEQWAKNIGTYDWSQWDGTIVTREDVMDFAADAMDSNQLAVINGDYYGKWVAPRNGRFNFTWSDKLNGYTIPASSSGDKVSSCSGRNLWKGSSIVEERGWKSNLIYTARGAVIGVYFERIL